MNKIITVENLKKSYGKVEAVKGIDFYVEKGKLFSFLGTNGAGKSTTIRMLCTLAPPDCGSVTIDGHRLGAEDAAICGKIGVVFQDSVLDSLLTVRENLTTRARFYGLSGSVLRESVNNAAAAADVTEYLDRPYGKLSGGQQRRADIARALVNRPSILFLDEPTTGLDPKTKEDVWATIRALQQHTGMTVFLTTHYMEEAATSDFIVIINRGEIAVKGTPYDLKKAYSYDTLRVKPKDPQQVLEIYRRLDIPFEEKNQILISPLDGTVSAIPILDKVKPYIESFEVVHGSMNDVFLNIAGGEERYV